MRIGWTTTSTLEEATKLASVSVKIGLAACAQIDGPVHSYYMWQGKLENSQEYRVTFKFLEKNASRLEDWIKENHAHEIPQWITIQADYVLPAYLNWMVGDSRDDSGRTVNLQQAVELSKLGNSLLRKRRFVEAEKTFRKALEYDSDNTYILVGLADLCRELHRFTESTDFYERTLALDPTNIFALRGMGDAYRGMDQSEKAHAYWKRYLEQNKDDIHVMTRLADSYLKLGNFKESEGYYLQALNVNGKDKYALLGLGNLYYKMGDQDHALLYFEKLLSLDGSYVAVLTMVGNIFRRRKEYDRASTYYEKAIQLEPGNTFALYGMGDSLRGLKNHEQAIQWWLKILDKEPQNQNLRSRVADAFYFLDRFDEAADHYHKSLAVGFDPYALLGLSRVYRHKGVLDEAEACCEKVLTQIPDDARFLEEMALVCDQKGDSEKAEEIRARIQGE